MEIKKSNKMDGKNVQVPVLNLITQKIKYLRIFFFITTTGTDISPSQ